MELRQHQWHPSAWEYPLNADPESQLRLLELAELDAKLGRLAHRRRTLPEIAALEEAEAERQRHADLGVRVRLEAEELERDRDRHEADIATVVARRERDQKRLDAGQVGSPRELQSLQSEIEALQRRQAVLEDAELEIMERLEATLDRHRELETLTQAAATRATETRAARDAQWREIDTEAEQLSARRASIAETLPGDLLALYDKLRAQLGGVGAARLHQRRCEGCRLELSPTDLRRFKAAPADEVLRCEECRRILVRTPESGL